MRAVKMGDSIPACDISGTIMQATCQTKSENKEIDNGSRPKEDYLRIYGNRTLRVGGKSRAVLKEDSDRNR